MTLCDLNIDQTATVKGFTGDMNFQSRLVEMGILPRVRIRLIKFSPLGGPVEIKVRNYYVSIRKHDASNILITL